MGLGIMFLNMLKLRRLPKRRHIPIQHPHPPMQRRIPRSDIPNVALEMLHVHGIEADDGGVEADVCLGDVLAVVVGSGVSGEVGFGAIEGGEERCDGVFVGGLGGGEAGFVDAVVDVVVGPLVRGFDVVPPILGEQVDFLVLFWKKVVEFGVEHADYLAGLVADYPVLLEVVQGRDCEAPRVVRVDVKVDVPQMCKVLVQWIRRHVISWDFLIWLREPPAFR